MISKYKKDYEKTVMGYLSYLPDFKNIKNLQEEMKLYTSDSNQFEVLIYHKMVMLAVLLVFKKRKILLLFAIYLLIRRCVMKKQSNW